MALKISSLEVIQRLRELEALEQESLRDELSGLTDLEDDDVLFYDSGGDSPSDSFSPDDAAELEELRLVDSLCARVGGWRYGVDLIPEEEFVRVELDGQAYLVRAWQRI